MSNLTAHRERLARSDTRTATDAINDLASVQRQLLNSPRQSRMYRLLRQRMRTLQEELSHHRIPGIV